MARTEDEGAELDAPAATVLDDSPTDPPTAAKAAGPEPAPVEEAVPAVEPAAEAEPAPVEEAVPALEPVPVQAPVPAGVGARSGARVETDRDTVKLPPLPHFLRRRMPLRPAGEQILVPGGGAIPRPARPPEPETDEVDFGPLLDWARGRDRVRWALGAMIGVWSLVFIVLGWQRQDRFATFGFDLGVYDQSVWLLSRFKDPFITLRGLTQFGFHMNLILIPLVPFYWLGAGPHFLLVFQVAAQASGAVAIYLLARDRLADRWLAVCMAAVLLLNPTYQYLTWEFFHPDAVAIAPLLFAYWAARAKRWGWFTVAAVLAVACKEDVALSLFVLGILIWFWGDRQVGAVTAALSALWFALSTKVILPSFNGIGAFYDSFFGEFGNTPLEVVRTVITKPGLALDTATQPDRMNYYRMMFAPVAFIPFAKLSTLMVAMPMLAINVLSTFPYQREIRYHYAALVLAGLMLATVEGVARLGTTIGARRFLVGLLVATSFGATVAWGPSPLSVKYHSGLWAQGPDPRREAKQAAVDMIPAGAATSAIYYLAPHLTHRTKIYEFPVPWKNVNWGVKGENLDDPADVKWMALDRTLLSPDDNILLAHLLREQFVIRFEKENILVAERVAAGPPAP